MPHELLLAKGFTLLTPLGKGAYGQVWHALDPKGANVAVKVFHDSTAQAKAKDEAGALAAFDNAHLLRLHLLLEDSLQRQLYLVTEFAAGGDLLKLMQERECKPLPEEDIRRYFRQLLFALDHMHRRGWVHRDVKCENILLSEKRDHIILADFGFATQWSPTRYLTEPLGSLHYSAPEICAGEPYRGPEVDVWSMGVVLYALCTGRLPFGGSTEQEIADRIMAGVCPTPRTVSGPLRSVINALLTPDVAKRATLDQLKLHPWICGAGNKPNSVMPRVITDLHAPIAPLPAVRRPQERRGSMIGPRPTVPPTELPPTRPRHNSVVQMDEAVRAIAENQANIEAEVELESTADASAVIEAGALLTVETRDEDGFFARLSRFTKSGVKRFHLSRLGKGNKKDAKAEAHTHAHAAPPAASAPGLSPEKNRVAH